MLAHGISAAALFMIAGSLQERLHTREMGSMGGLWQIVPRLSAFALFFAMASLGLPGLGNFIGEFLVLLGAFKVNVLLTGIAVPGAYLGSGLFPSRDPKNRTRPITKSLLYFRFQSPRANLNGIASTRDRLARTKSRDVFDVSAPALKHEMEATVAGQR